MSISDPSSAARSKLGRFQAKAMLAAAPSLRRASASLARQSWRKLAVTLQVCALCALTGCSEGNTPAASPTHAPEAEPATLRSGPAATWTPPVEVEPLTTPTTLMVLGDSISAAYGIQREQGWVALLQAQVKRLGSEHRVVNASFSGETTGGGLARVTEALATHQPDLVILELGGNDGLRGYPTERIKANLAQIIEHCQAAGAEVLLLGMQIPPNYGPRYTKAFAEIFPALAEAYGLDLVPSFLEGVALSGNLMQADGIHPKAAAQPLLLTTVWPAIADFLNARHALAAQR